jgi:hypothetical protein
MPKTYHAIVLLANLMSDDGTLNHESRARADTAAAEFMAGRAPIVVPCGWAYLPGNPLPIADALRSYLIGLGVPPGSIVTEPRSRDTVGDAVLTRLSGRFPRPVVVTSDYHADRAGQIFSFVHGCQVDVIPSDSDSDSDSQAVAARDARERDSLEAFRRTFAGVGSGDLPAILQRMLASHPFYNGQVYPPLVLD